MSDYFKLYDEKGNVDAEAVRSIPTPHKLLLPLFELSPVDKQKSFLQAAAGVKSSAQSKRNRAAGQKFEREIAAKFGALFPRAARRSQYTGGRKDGCDVEGTPYWIECKYCDTMAFDKWWDQALADSHGDDEERECLVVYRKPRERTTWAMYGLEYDGIVVKVHADLDEFLEASRVEYGLRLREELTGSGRRLTVNGFRGWNESNVMGYLTPQILNNKACWIAESHPGELGTFPTRDAAEKAVRLAWEDGGADE